VLRRREYRKLNSDAQIPPGPLLVKNMASVACSQSAEERPRADPSRGVESMALTPHVLAIVAACGLLGISAAQETTPSIVGSWGSGPSVTYMDFGPLGRSLQS